jgi:hypothetical protein
MPLPYLWLFAFLIPLSGSMALWSQGEIKAARKPSPPTDDEDPDLAI